MKSKSELFNADLRHAERYRESYPINKPKDSSNRILTLLDPKDLASLRPYLEAVTLEYRQPLYGPDHPITHVWFIESGVASLVKVMINGDASEVGTIGNEGIVGIPLFLQDDRAPTSVYMQVPGSGFQMSAVNFLNACRQNADLRKILSRYTHAFFNQVAQSAACNHYHNIKQRTCRWLLMTRDRMHDDTFLLTQEFLAMMLGVRRSGVSAAASELQDEGIISYSRGVITIRDRERLERGACECYADTVEEFDRFLGKVDPVIA